LGVKAVTPDPDWPKVRVHDQLLTIVWNDNSERQVGGILVGNLSEIVNHHVLFEEFQQNFLLGRTVDIINEERAHRCTCFKTAVVGVS
jgi:hypothetical protein